MTQSGDMRGLVLAVLTYVLMFALKLGAYFVTGVMVLLAEALHTLSDILVSGFLLVALAWSRRKDDDVHIFGYGRAQNVAALVAATLFISFTSYKLFEESIPRLFRPEEAAYGNLWLALAVIITSMLVAAAPMTALLLQKQRGASAKAQLIELVNDQLGLLAALVGTLLICWGLPLGDPIAAMVVATIIALSAIALFRGKSQPSCRPFSRSGISGSGGAGRAVRRGRVGRARTARGICRAGCRSCRHAFGGAARPIGRGGTSYGRNGAQPGPSRNGRTVLCHSGGASAGIRDARSSASACDDP
jgi:hypothetical protein